MPRPRMLVCYLCGREYGTMSLPIHVPQCQQKWRNEELKKPKRERRKMPEPPPGYLSGGRGTGTGGAAGPDDGRPAYCVPVGMSAADKDAFNESAFATYNEQALAQCPNCGRTFTDTAMRSHAKSCTAERPAKPAGTGLSPAARSGPVFGGAAAVSPARLRPRRQGAAETAPDVPRATFAASAAPAAAQVVGEPAGASSPPRVSFAATSGGGGAAPRRVTRRGESPSPGRARAMRSAVRASPPDDARPATASGLAPPVSFDDFKEKSAELKGMVDSGLLSQEVFQKWQAKWLGVTF